MQAQTERVYIATDRPAYVSGDRIWCSLFCMDRNGVLSRESAVAYVELISAEGTAAQAKISLLNGRGCGTVELPVQVPTGNYRMVAYTALEGGETALQGSKVLSVYNPFSLARVGGGVTVVTTNPTPVKTGDVNGEISVNVPRKVGAGKPFTAILQGVPSDLCLSVYLEDGLEQVENGTLEGFLKTFPADAVGSGSCEYDGEVVSGTAIGAPAGNLAILSSAGSPDDTYFTYVEENGDIHFATGNIYGNREMVCLVQDAGEEVRIRLNSPFLHPSVDSLPVLHLHESQFEMLVRRKSALSSLLSADTLYTFLPRREDQMLSGVAWERYHLDDYTRFHSVEEIIVEILPSVRLRRNQLEVSVPDGTENVRKFKDKVLVMLDGVVIPDISLLLNLDAMLLEDIYVCRENIVSGQLVYNGVVNFVSKMNYVRALNFPENVYVLDFPGVSYPLAYLGAREAGMDMRQLLYWNPALYIKKGESRRIELAAPAYAGRFCVVAEGLSDEGKAVRAVTYFEVE